MDDVLSDLTQIPQVAMNLCNNAAHMIRGDAEVLKLSPPQEELDPELATIYPDIIPVSYLKLTVNDMRHGMTPPIVESVFRPCFITNTYLPAIQREIVPHLANTVRKVLDNKEFRRIAFFYRHLEQEEMR